MASDANRTAVPSDRSPTPALAAYLPEAFGHQSTAMTTLALAERALLTKAALKASIRLGAAAGRPSSAVACK